MKALLFVLLFTQNAFALHGKDLATAKEAFVASLHINDRDNTKVDHFCSGVLISSVHIVTAGHCIDVMGKRLYGRSDSLIYQPELVVIKIGTETIRARSITFSEKYFEGTGLEAEDLALIELRSPVRNTSPVAILGPREFRRGMSLTLIAKKKKVTTRLLDIKSGALLLSREGGACAGDSGGAVIVKKNGQQLLAGILMYDGEGPCEVKTGYAHYPRGQF